MLHRQTAADLIVSPTMAITPQVNATIRGFTEIILGGIPVLLRQNETAFLSFMCSVAAIDALSGYRYHDVYGGAYSKNGTSKAKHLRAFWEIETDPVVAALRKP